MALNSSALNNALQQLLSRPTSIPALSVNTPPDLTLQYNTPLPEGQQQAFTQWISSLPPQLRSSRDYDLQGAFLSGISPSANAHFPDTFKKPNHVSFSTQSKYSTPENVGGVWMGDNQFTPSALNYQYHLPEILARLVLQQNPQAGFSLDTRNAPK